MRARIGALGAWALVGWVLVAFFAVVLLDVWAGPAQAELVLLVAIAPWLLFGAWPVAVAALVTRRWLLAAGGVAVVAVQVFVLLPSFAPWHTPAPAVPGTTFTVLDANVKYDNAHLGGLGQQILAEKPDVVTLEELSYFNLTSLQTTGALAGYRYSDVLPTYDARGYGVWSKLPLSDLGPVKVGGLPMIAGVVAAPGGPVDLLVVHTVSPPAGSASWKREMHGLAVYAAARRGLPLLMVGDFNATLAMREMRHVLDAGMQDAAAADGKGWEMSWAANGRTIVPIIRIDHALTTRSLTTSDYRPGRPSGSDHRPLLVTVGRRA